LKAANGCSKQLPLSSAAEAIKSAKKSKAILTATEKTADGQLTNSHHLIHVEARKTNSKVLSENRTKKQNDMQSHQSITSSQITQKFTKEVNIRGTNDNRDSVGLPTSPINSRNSGMHEIKSPVRHFGSPPRNHCNSSSAMIPERDVEPVRMPASPPTITQATIAHPNYKPIPQRAVVGPASRGVTAQSTPVKAHAALVTSNFTGKFYVANSTTNVNSDSNLSKVDVRTKNNVDDKPKHFHSQNPTNLPAPQPTKPTIHYQPNHHQPNGIINHPPVPHQFHPQLPQTAPNLQQTQLDTTSQQHLKTSSVNVNVTRTHHHNGSGSLEFHQPITGFNKIQECNSSSDENRSSGHASMSDTGGGNGSSSPGSNKTAQLGSVPEDCRLTGGVSNRNGRSRASTGKPRHRNVLPRNPWNGNGIEDIKASLQQMTMRSQTSTSTYSSLSAGSESSEPARRLGRYSSLETVNTNVTSADEFVWVDSHNRLVELQHPPWSQYCLMRVVRTGRCRDFAERVSTEAVPRLGYLLSRALVRISREIQRLSSVLGLCSKHEVVGAFKMILCPALADSCIKACLRAAAMFFLSGDGTLKQTKSARAGLQLPVGRFHRWMVDARLGKLVHEYAAVYLCAGFENLLEEILLQCIPSDPSVNLTAMSLENAIANSGDLWGLLQPFVHLNAGRIASGALTMPRWSSESSVGNSNQNGSHHNINGHSNGNISNINSSSTNVINTSKQEPCLLTTCVGSLAELKDLVNRSQKRSNHITMSQAALRELFYFMRCSQLEHNEGMYAIHI
jgi:ankyrin repeat and BTB/POZ domain-containing protein 2